MTNETPKTKKKHNPSSGFHLMLSAFKEGRFIMSRDSWLYGVSGSAFHRRLTDYRNLGYVIHHTRKEGNEQIYWMDAGQVEAAA